MAGAALVAVLIAAPPSAEAAEDSACLRGLPPHADPTRLEAAAGAREQRGDAACAAELWRVAARRHLARADYDASLAAAEQALRLVGGLRGSADPIFEARLLRDRGNTHFYRLDYDAARADFERALAILGAADEPELRVAIRQDLGITYTNSARPDLGLVHLHRAAEEAEALLPGGAWPSLLSNLGTVYERLDSPPLALAVYERARSLAAAAGSPKDLHDSLTRLGALRLDHGRIAEARADLEEALRLAESFEGKLERSWTLAYLAWARERDGDREGAIAAQRQVVELASRLGHAPTEREARASLAQLLLEDRPEEARRWLDEAPAVDGEAKLWRVEEMRAAWERRWGDGESAVAACERALARLEAWRDRLVAGEARRSLQGASRELYERCWGLALERGDVGAAFSLLERARAPAWRASRSLAASDADALAGRLVELDQRRDRLAEAGATDEDALEPVELEIEQIRHALGGAGVRPPAPTLSAAALAARLSPHTVLVAYAWSADRMFAFVLTRETLRSVELDLERSELGERVENFVELVAADRRDGWTAAGAALYGDLVAPLRPLLPESARRLVVVADGELSLLPFDALVTQPPGGSARARFLLDDLGVSYAASAADWAAPPAPGPPPSGSLVVGDPAVSSGAAADLVRATYEREGLRPAALPFARREATRLAASRADETSLLSGDAAAEAAVKQRLRAGARLAHFATHGFASSWSDRRSALVLAPAGGEDGFLQARELRAMSLRLDLVVLAACRTAAGRARAGDHVRSLAYSFVEAGARSVVAASWEVPDESTYELMRAFYAALQDGHSRVEALRLAKLERLERGEPPSAWAALVLVGDGDAGLREGWRVEPERPSRLLIAMVTGLGAALLAVAALVRARRPLPAAGSGVTVE